MTTLRRHVYGFAPGLLLALAVGPLRAQPAAPPAPPVDAPVILTPDPPDEGDDEQEGPPEIPPPDAEPAASDIISDVESTTTGGETPTGKPGDPPATDPPSTEMGEFHTLERAIRVELLPPAPRPLPDHAQRQESRKQPGLGLHLMEVLGTEGVGRYVRTRQSEEETRALRDQLRKNMPQRMRFSGPLGPLGNDIPMVDNEMVRKWITFFQGVGAKYYRLWVARYWRYGPMMRRILVSQGMPSDTVFLSMIESGFSPKAYSFAHAAGPWQFIRVTGTHMGLAVNYWVDERRDPVKSTYAASRYLLELYKTWHDWHLAWASYNTGPGRVSRAIKRQQSRDFFVLTKGRTLRWETRNYVPKLLAAATIAQDPAAYGFGDIEPLPPFEFDVINLKDNIHLQSLAKACGTELDVLLELNPALRRPITPPPAVDGEPFEVRVPPATLSRCQQGMLTLTDGERMRYRRHRVGPGETMPTLAARYHTTPEAVVTENNLPNHKLRTGEDLIIPIPHDAGEVPPGDMEDDIREARGKVVKTGPPRGTRAIKVAVGKGETLWDIAQRHGVDVRSVASWNGLNRRRRLRIGQTLTIWVKDTRAAPSGKAAPPK